MKGWIRPLRKQFWSIVPGRRKIHLFMSTQALTMGGTCLTVFIALGFSKTLILTTLYITIAAVLYGSLVDQPELDNGEDTNS